MRSFETIAEAVILLGNIIVPEYFMDEAYDGEVSNYLVTLVTTVYFFTYVFEVEFEHIFSVHCHGNMTNEDFTNFINPRIKLLSQIKGYFGYILPCAFVREIMSRFKLKFGYIHFIALAQKSLATFFETKDEESKPVNIWPDLLNYCAQINAKFDRINSSSQNELFNVVYKRDSSSVAENSEFDADTSTDRQLNECFNRDKTDLDSANSVKNTEEKVQIISEAEWNQQFDLIKAISEISLEYKAGKGAMNKDVNQLRNIGVLNSETNRNMDYELNQMYDIIMPDIKLRYKVLDLIGKCKNYCTDQTTKCST